MLGGRVTARVQAVCLQGLEFDTTSAGALAASLRTLKADGSAAATAEVLQLLFTKPMQVCGAAACAHAAFTV